MSLRDVVGFLFGANRRRAPPSAAFPPEWLGCLEENVPLYRRLPEVDQARLRDALGAFVGAKHWEGCHGLTITAAMQVTVAAHACLLTLGWEGYHLEEPRTILIYPGSYLATDNEEESVKQWRLGEALYRGPVALSWWHARWDSRRLGQSNLVLHEFAHKLAEGGDWATGRPPIASPQLYERWEEVIAPEYDRLVKAAVYDRPAVLDHYGATNRTEFFAVATESFFLQPEAMRGWHPALYQLLAEFYGQDPAAWKPLDPAGREQTEAANQEYWRQALAECDVALRLRPEWAEAYQRRAGCHWRLGEYDKAIEDYGHVIHLTVGDELAQAHCDRGGTYRDAGRYEAALRDFDWALELLPTFTEAYRQRGITFREQGNLERALADLTHALRLDPQDELFHIERGIIHALRKEYPQALRDFDQALELYPYGEGTYLRRAEVQLALEEYAKAVADCDEALRLDPTYTDVYRVRAEAYAALGEPEKARRDRARAEESAGDSDGHAAG